jgi:L-fuconolactonase
VISSKGAVDAHHRLWNPSDPGQGWLADPALATIRGRFDLLDLHDAVGAGVAGRPVTATVLVQSVDRTDETERLLATAADDDLVAAVVGWKDLTGDVPTQLKRLRAGYGGHLLRGVRHLVHDEPDPRLWLREDVLAGLRALANVDLPCGLLVRPPQLSAAVERSRRLPGLRLVLDHAGKPDLASGDLEGWSRNARALARSEQVVCKVSGLITEADHQRWSLTDLFPAWETLLDAFGPPPTVRLRLAGVPAGPPAASVGRPLSPSSSHPCHVTRWTQCRGPPVTATYRLGGSVDADLNHRQHEEDRE